MTTLLLADDHCLFRQGLAALLGNQGPWEIVGEASSGEEAVRLAQQHQPDIAVIDVSMPGMSGIEAVPLIKRASPNTRIVALSMYGDFHYQELMFKAGASAYVLKNEAISELIDAIQAVLRGERFVSSVVTPIGAPLSARSADLDQRLLSEREIEVLRLLAEGQRTKEVAERLGISAKTVETYRSRVMLKLGIDNLAELVKFAIRAGIASTEL
ncbi:MAG: response regulator transcription factor [Candidatus Contendobacter sp.]|nr:response regulator transcription factor [Candidatus Contendobacter sp.]